MQSETKRLFLAIEVPDEWKTAIEHFIDSNSRLPYKWIAEQNWHFTLLFIGSFPSGKLNSIYEVFKKCFGSIKPFEIEFDGFTYFPKNRPRMIWCKGKTSDAFTLAVTSAYKNLKHFCNMQYMEWNEKPEKMPIPHITLSRIRDLPRPGPELKTAGWEPKPFSVNDIYLFESKLKPAGAEYIKLAKFNLAKS